ncbi:unnamed protein product, partial [Chrysoparadoxa australica]
MDNLLPLPRSLDATSDVALRQAFPNAHWGIDDYVACEKKPQPHLLPPLVKTKLHDGRPSPERIPAARPVPPPMQREALYEDIYDEELDPSPIGQEQRGEAPEPKMRRPAMTSNYSTWEPKGALDLQPEVCLVSFVNASTDPNSPTLEVYFRRAGSAFESIALRPTQSTYRSLSSLQESKTWDQEPEELLSRGVSIVTGSDFDLTPGAVWEVSQRLRTVVLPTDTSTPALADELFQSPGGLPGLPASAFCVTFQSGPLGLELKLEPAFALVSVSRVVPDSQAAWDGRIGQGCIILGVGPSSGSGEDEEERPESSLSEEFQGTRGGSPYPFSDARETA